MKLHKLVLPLAILLLVGILIGTGIAVAALVVNRTINVTVSEPVFSVSPSADVAVTVAPGATVQTDYGIHNNTDSAIGVRVDWSTGGGLVATASVLGSPITSGSTIGIDAGVTETVWFEIAADNGDTSAPVSITFTEV